ncbi:MAG: cyclase family protein [Bacteroidetes bacterium]|nr:cyclase family protein [Bacteroidota bacterium]
MKATFNIKEQDYKVDISKPIDLSIPLQANGENPNAWYISEPEIKPVQLDGWIGKVSEGAAVNFNNIAFNPHSHGTHTECVGHITKDFYSVNKALKTFFFLAEVISVIPEERGEDRVITAIQLKQLLNKKRPEAVVIRTRPNPVTKKNKNYDYTNWPYLEEAAAMYLRDIGVNHLLIDLPSVDKEKDEGALLAHRAFWNYPKETRHDATITEFIYVSNKTKDGCYLLNLQIAPFENDASPSKPILYEIL